MKVLFTGRKTRIGVALKVFTEEKLAKIERVLDAMLDTHVILTLEKHSCLAEIIFKARTVTLTARGEGHTFQDAVMVCVDRLMAQAKKHHDRKRKRRERGRERGAPRRLAPGRGKRRASGDGDARASVVRMGRVPAKPMSVTEALLQARDLPDPFVVFLNEESQRIAVIYKRSDGRFGLVEPEL
ncbi:MAG: ribosome-associated translation inhibitor RaiA [Acidobacteria bacterium]|nr:ribosome-associated translation inhibitor RaiA [Acidobacteriota bacterium]